MIQTLLPDREGGFGVWGASPPHPEVASGHTSSKSGGAAVAAREGAAVGFEYPGPDEDWQRIRREEPTAVLCVAGDLNQDLLARGHFYGSAKGRQALSETLRQVGLVCLTAGDADPVARLGGGRASIDHLCVAGLPTDELMDVSAWPSHDLLGARLTDHHGVAVRLPSLSGVDPMDGRHTEKAESRRLVVE